MNISIKKIKKLNTKKTTGFDNFSTKLVKYLSFYLGAPLLQSFYK